MGRPQKYATDEERKEARLARSREYNAKHRVVRAARAQGKQTALIAMVQTINKKLDLLIGAKSEELR